MRPARVLPPTVAHLSRRRFLAGAGGTVLGWSAHPAAGQALPVIGYVGPESPDLFMSRLAAFRQGLAEAGFVEGRNVTVEYRWAEGRYSRLPQLASDLVSRPINLLVAPGGAEVALAAKAASSTLPIVFEMGGDPVALGIVGSLARPGGNMTGVSSLSVEVSRKRLEFMRELQPAAALLAIAANPASPTAEAQLANLRIAARTLSVDLKVFQATTDTDFENLFVATKQAKAAGLVFTSDPYFAFRSRHLAALAVAHAVPATTQSRDFPNAGGLMSYGGDFTQSHRQTGVYAGRVLKGERPSDLPVHQVTKVELVVNLKAAGQLGVVIPAWLASSADALIE